MKSSTLSRLPTEVRHVLDHYLVALRDGRLPIDGVYLYGSLCLGGFDQGSSDIDLLALTSQRLAAEEVDRLRVLHDDLQRAVPMAHRLDLTYLPLLDATSSQASAITCPVVRDGDFFAAGSGDVNAVTWWQIQHDGLVLHGPPLSSLVPPVAWDAVEAAMHHNLTVYWPARAAEPDRFLDDYWVQFAVTTLCRILTTLDAQQLETKNAAVARWAQHLPPRWHLLLRETSRIRHDPDQPPLYSTPEARAQDVQGFLAYIQQRGLGRTPTACLTSQGSDLNRH